MLSNSLMPAKKEKIKARFLVTVAIDDTRRQIDFYCMDSGDKSSIIHTYKGFKTKIYSTEFLTELTEAVKEFTDGRQRLDDTYTTLVLPDRAFATDTIIIPTISRKRNDDALEATLAGLFKKRSEVQLNSFLSLQNKQITVYGTTAIGTATLTSVSNAVAAGGITPSCVTFAANATVNAAEQISSKLKNASYLFLDIKEGQSRFAFVAKGRTTGYYDLPFGFSVLSKTRLTAEDMLFDHSIAELAVLNAREKAKAKQLTTISPETDDEDGFDDDMTDEEKESDVLDSMFGNDENATSDPTAASPGTIKTLPKKQPRKLPKFMLREQPHEEDEYVYENFRIFIKWALNLIQNNERLATQGKPENVVVNLPAEYDFLFEMTNREKAENGIEFVPFDTHGERTDIIENLELFGGLTASQFHKNNNF